MTTLTLFLLALGKAIDSGETFDITRKKIMNYYLINNDEDDDKFYKLVFTQRDNETLTKHLSDKELSEEYSQKIVKNLFKCKYSQSFYLLRIKKSCRNSSLL